MTPRRTFGLERRPVRGRLCLKARPSTYFAAVHFRSRFLGSQPTLWPTKIILLRVTGM